MTRIATILLLAATAAPMSAIAAKPCEELKTEIAAKVDAAGVKGYALDVVAADADEAGSKVVGTCNAGKGKILYRREGGAPAAPAAPKAAASSAT